MKDYLSGLKSLFEHYLTASSVDLNAQLQSTSTSSQLLEPLRLHSRLQRCFLETIRASCQFMPQRVWPGGPYKYALWRCKIGWLSELRFLAFESRIGWMTKLLDRVSILPVSSWKCRAVFITSSRHLKP